MEISIESATDCYFAIQLKLERDDIKNLGFDISQLKKGDMEYIAMRLRDDYLKQMYSSALKDTIEYYMKHQKR